MVSDGVGRLVISLLRRAERTCASVTICSSFAIDSEVGCFSGQATVAAIIPTHASTDTCSVLNVMS